MTYTGHNRRNDKPGRRDDDYSTCPFHEGTCEDIKKLESGTLPRWVFTWIGGPVVAMVLAFGAWTALKATDNAERLSKLEVYQEVAVANQAILMKHFDLVPILPDKR